MLNFVGKKNKLGQTSLILLCILSLSKSLSAQEKNTYFLQMAKRSYAAITADLVQLNRIADYQSEIIKLAQEDPAGASNFIRSALGCAQRSSVLRLCEHLTQSYLKNEEVLK